MFICIWRYKVWKRSFDEIHYTPDDVPLVKTLRNTTPRDGEKQPID